MKSMNMNDFMSVPDISLRKAFSFIQPAMVRTWHFLILMALFTAATGGIGLLSPYLGKLLVDRGITAEQPRMVVYFGLLILLSYLIGAALNTAGQLVSAAASNRFVLNLKSLVLTRLLKLPIEFFDKQRSGYLVGRVNEPDAIAVIFSPAIFQPVSTIIQAVGALVIMTAMGGSVIILLVPFLLVIFFTTTWLNRRLRTSTYTLLDSSARTAGGLQEVVFGISDLKNYDLENRKLGETLGQYKDLADKRLRQSVFMSIGMNILGFFGNSFNVAVMIMVGIYVANGSMTLGDYIALTGYALKLLAPAQVLGNLSMTFQPAIVALKRLGIIFDSETENELWGEKKVERLRGSLEFKEVSFGYNGTDRLVLQKCDFTISPGECVAIVGKNGSGKTTILKLLLGSYHNYTGGIFIDGSELHDFDITSLRGRIGLVSQNAFFFTGTLLENIRMAALNVSKEEIDRVIRLSGCLRLFENSLESIRIEENGKNLSGGQRQAAAVARCLLKRPDILLFDEATTHLDQATCQVVLHAIRNVFPDRTRIIITHDRDIAEMADRILQIEDGSITELSHSPVQRT
jgi:ABC-type bacteriocin/lantibiotic exporter with double-glycine peptidase domain